MGLPTKQEEISSSPFPSSRMSRLQIVCHFMAIFDMLFYFGTIITSVIIEISVTEMRPIRIVLGENGTVSVALSRKNELMAIWDYLNTQHYSSSTVYNAVYMSMIVIAVGYLIIEVWLACVLIRGATEKSVGHCKRWFWWRMVIILATVLVACSDLVQMQYTLTLLLFIPLNVYRLFLIVLVLHLIGEINADNDYNNGKGSKSELFRRSSDDSDTSAQSC